MGDVKMLAMVGAFVGWQLTLLTLIESALGAVALVAIVRRLPEPERLPEWRRRM